MSSVARKHLLKQLVVGGGLANELHHVEPQPRAELGSPVPQPLRRQRLHRRDVHCPRCALAGCRLAIVRHQRSLQRADASEEFSH